MALELPYGIKRTTPGLLDEYAGPYADTAAAQAGVPDYLKPNQTVKIGDRDYHWVGGFSIDNLVVKVDQPLTSAEKAQIAQSAEDITSLGGSIPNVNPSDQPGVTAGVPSNVTIVAPASAGTFTNFGGVLVSSDDLLAGIVQLKKIGGVWLKKILPINLTGYSTTQQLGTKLTKITGSNLLDPATFKYGYYYFQGQNSDLQIDGALYNGMSDLIEAKHAGLITTGAGLTSQGLSSYAVFDINKNWIRNGQNTNQYTWQSGDAYVSFIYSIGGNANFADTVAVVEGTTYSFEEYTDFKPVTDLSKKTKLLEDGKLDAVIGNNLLNPGKFRFGYLHYTGVNSELVTSGGNYYGMTDFIPASANGLTTTGAGTTSIGLSSYVVYNAAKVRLRNGQNSNHYTYQSGDAFVSFIYFIDQDTDFPNTVAVVEGSVYHFEKYTDFKPLLDVENRVAELEASDIKSLSDVINGTPLVYGNVSNTTGYSARSIDNDWIENFHSSGGNNYLTTVTFTPTGTKLIHIKFTAAFTKTATSAGIIIYIIGNISDPTTWYTLPPFSENGDYDITFDPAFYNVYRGFTSFTILLSNENIASGGSMTVRYTNFKIFENENESDLVNIKGPTAKALFESTDAALSSIKASLIKEPPRVSPSGNKYELAVTDNGLPVYIPIVPNKAEFRGNSLIAGFGSYGMAASQSNKDYYYLITEYIKVLKPSLVYNKAPAVYFENVDNVDDITGAVSTFVGSLSADAELVVIQLGDNVNTAEKAAVFPTSSLELCRATRIKCPNARVFWMGMWFGNTEKYAAIENACLQTGCKLVSFSGLPSSTTNSHIGAVSKTMTGSKTLSGVTNVVANTSTNLTVTFTVDGSAYTSTLDVTSYSLTSGTLTYAGDYEIISIGGIAAHPGDEGFRLIANKFLYEAGLTTDSEYYK